MEDESGWVRRLFYETRPAAPPWRFDTQEARQALLRWWVRDPLDGLPYAALHHLFRMLPTETASALGARLGRRQVTSRPVATARARAALRLLCPEAGEAEIERLVEAHWTQVGRSLAEFSALHRLWREGRIEVAGREHLERVRASGRPLVLAGMHMANWEALHASLKELGQPFASIAQILPNRFRMAIVNQTRLRTHGWDGIGVLLPANARAMVTARRLLERRRHALLYHVDEYWRGRVAGPALGRPLRDDGNMGRAVRLAIRHGAALLPLHVLRLGDAARFRLNILPEIPLAELPAGEAGVKAGLAALDAVVEGVLRAYPEQWFHLHVFNPDR